MKKIFTKLIEYLYTGRIKDLSAEYSFDLLLVSHELVLPRLTLLCERVIEASLEIDTAYDILQAAIYYNLPQLINACLNFMALHNDQIPKNIVPNLSVEHKKQFLEYQANYIKKLSYIKDLDKIKEKTVMRLYSNDVAFYSSIPKGAPKK